MDCSLQHILKSLCLNTEWKYAVFWKLKHRARMVLTWEDAYYDNHDHPSENKGVTETPTNSHVARCAHDPLGLAVAKLSYHVYSMGEGIIGRVADSGKHQWIFAEPGSSSCLSFELYDEWHSHFSAGIQTILVVAVGRLGVLQLGSLNNVPEDATFLTRIRYLFSVIKDSSIGQVTSSLQCRMMTSASLHGLPPKDLVGEYLDCLGNTDRAVNINGSSYGLQVSHYSINQRDGQLDADPSDSANQIKVLEDTKPVSAASDLDLKHQNHLGLDFFNDVVYGGDTSHLQGLAGGLEHIFHTQTSCSVSNVASSYGLCSYLGSAVNNSFEVGNLGAGQEEMLQLSGSLENKYTKDLKKTYACQIESSNFDATGTSGSFAGSELLEALGPAFQKAICSVGGEADKTEAETAVSLAEVLSASQLTFDSVQENLLEAVVANVYPGCSVAEHETSSSISLQSMLTSDKMIKPSSHKLFVDPVVCSINRTSIRDGNTSQSSSEICGAFSSIGFSSTCPSTCSEQFERSMEIPKKNKKRVKPGESSRPRPRDRQLIQDRLKELRELIPNGSKCSIDSLLERTIKHMLFLQNVNKHAEKLSKCAESKMQSKEADMLRTSNLGHGSSWAVEVGGHLKVCSIVVENLNKQGMVLIEMLCEECDHFLEIAEAIRSLGLVILNGVTEAHGEKTCLCFVVEGPNNKSMARMDILWSLLQIFQPKAKGKTMVS